MSHILIVSLILFQFLWLVVGTVQGWFPKVPTMVISSVECTRLVGTRCYLSQNKYNHVNESEDTTFLFTVQQEKKDVCFDDKNQNWIPKVNSNNHNQRNLPEKEQLQSCGMDTDIISKQQLGQKQQKQQQKQQNIVWKAHDSINAVTLVPISMEPMILQSSAPLLNEEECKKLCELFRSNDLSNIDPNNNNNNNNNINNNDNNTRRSLDNYKESIKLLERVQNQIDALTGCFHHNGESKFPRYISYTPESLLLSSNEDEIPSAPLLQDGLHVDTNNGRLFRHMTVLLYLTTMNQSTNYKQIGGATTFPLARHVHQQCWDDPTAKVQLELHKEQVTAAQKLLDWNVHHTRYRCNINTTNNYKNHKMDVCTNTELIRCADLVEESANQLYKITTNPEMEQSHPFGVRIVPQAGYICVIVNVLPNGQADPLSFHAGETLYDCCMPQSSSSSSSLAEDKHNKSNKNNENLPSFTTHTTKKELLTFFKEIPMSMFTTREEFGSQVRLIRERLLQKYY